MNFARAIVIAIAIAVAIGRSADAAELTPLNVAVFPTDSTAQVYYAQDLGYFRDAGFDVHITSIQSTSAIVSAIMGGGIDIGSVTVSSAANARARGLGVKFIAPAGLYVSTASTAELVTIKGSHLKKPADFVGKTIAVNGLSDLVYFSSRAWLDAGGVDSTKAKYVELSLPEMLDALKQRRVDAAVLIEPFYAAASDEVQVVAPVDDYVSKRLLASGWLASDTWLQAHPDLAARFIAVMKKTAEWANAHRTQSAEILLRYTKLTPSVAAKMTRVIYGTTLDASLLTPVIANAQKYDPFPSPVTASDIMWTPRSVGATR
jgi:NitT/TauT family transport system substrate-binding protein